MNPEGTLLAAGGADRNLTLFNIDHKLMRQDITRGDIRASNSPNPARKVTTSLK